MFAMNSVAGESLLINLGASATRISLSKPNGIVYMSEIALGQNDLSRAISDRFGIPLQSAIKIKEKLSSSLASQNDQFEMTDGIIIADIKNLVFDFEMDLARHIARTISNEGLNIPDKVILFGGGSNIEGAQHIFSEVFDRTVRISDKNALMQSVGRVIFMQHKDKMEKFKKNRFRKFFRKLILKLTNKTCTVQPSSLAFEPLSISKLIAMESAGITTIHYDFMDGQFVPDNIGSAEEVKFIKSKSNLKVSAHLMAIDPLKLVGKFIRSGADAIILSLCARHLARALAEVKQAGKKCGVALNMDDELKSIMPIIQHLDVIVEMSVAAGKGGQKFRPESLAKVRALVELKKKHKLKFDIVMDGGINSETAAECWKAGTTALAVGNYLARSTDLKTTVQSLMSKNIR
jgi:ribulose-phosphate 3-epimerase